MSGEERDETPRIDVSKIRAQWEHRKSPNIGTPSPSRSSIESSRSFNSTSTTTRSALSSASPPPRPPKAAHLSSIQSNTSQSSDLTRRITEQSPGLPGNVHRTEHSTQPSLNLPAVSQPPIASPEKRNLSPTRSPWNPGSSAKVPQPNGHHPTRLPPSAQPPSRKTTMEENSSRVGINPSGCQLRDDLLPVASPRSSEGDDETASRRSTQSSNSERPASSQKQKIGIQKPIHGFLRWSNNVKGYTVNRARTGAQSMLDKTGFYHVYLRTKEDIDDAKSSQKGQEGICSRCRSIAATFGGTVRRQLGWSGEWATPLSRILLHSNWCLLCGLILNTMCDPELDPLRHPAVANYIQPNLKGHTMKTWTERGWEFNELNWPFGHGDHRHEGSSHVLSAAFEPLETLFIKALYSVGYRKLREILGSTTANFRVAENEIALREELQRARAPSKHPLSCVVKITRPEAQDPSLLMVTLWGFGRQPNASLQVLSSFPLFLADSNSRHDSLIPSYNRLGKLLDPRWIDPSVAKTWLKKCKERHGTKCSAPGWASSVERPASLRVLDVKHLCIKVPSSLRACEYVALSYVWGKTDMLVLNKGNYEMLTKKDGLQKYWNRLPRTIVDAIQVVRDMGERYLWVDTLCIIQDSPDKHEHIKNMDRIYSSALATLVAADGETADHGLIGVSNSR